MIKLIALVVAMIAGEPVTETFTYTQLFDDMGSCEAVRTGATGETAVEQLRKALEDANPGVEITITTQCAPAE